MVAPRQIAFVASLGIAAVASAESCPDGTGAPSFDTIYTAGWGFDPQNSRHQGPDRTSINAGNAARLTVKWAYGLGTDTPRSMPLVTDDTIFLGDTGRGLLALDRDTGCARWELPWGGEFASAILHRVHADGVMLYFADRNAGIVAVDARSGRLLWQRQPEIVRNPVPMFSGTPLIHGETIFMPISSQEIGLSLVPFYGCCTTSGGMAAMDATTGDTRWYVPTIEEPVRVVGRRWLFVERRGPPGAPVWGAPTLDPASGTLFFGTGQNYSHPTTDTSDAIFAVDAATGERRWMRQFTANDAYNISCDIVPNHPNCPDPLGPDVDFGAPLVFAALPDGTPAVIAGQKSGDVHAMRADDGSVIWQRKLGRGGALGGVHSGIALNAALGLVYAPISDIDAGRMTGPGPAKPGVYALDVADGSVVWSRERAGRCPERYCWGGVSAAVSGTDEVLFSGSLDGYLEALDAATGEVLWSFDTWQDFETVNGVPARGGAFDTHGPMIAGDMVIVSSGYSAYFQAGGNALLVFAVGEEDSP